MTNINNITNNNFDNERSLIRDYRTREGFKYNNLRLFFIIKFGTALMILKVRNTFVSRGISKPKYLVMNQGCTKSDKLFDFVCTPIIFDENQFNNKRTYLN